MNGHCCCRENHTLRIPCFTQFELNSDDDPQCAKPPLPLLKVFPTESVESVSTDFPLPRLAWTKIFVTFKGPHLPFQLVERRFSNAPSLWGRAADAEVVRVKRAGNPAEGIYGDAAVATTPPGF